MTEKCLKFKTAIGKNRKLIVGLILVVFVAVLWVAGGSFMQYVYSSDFRKPFFVTYFSMSLFTIYFAGFTIFPSWRQIEFRDNTKRSNPYNQGAINPSVTIENEEISEAVPLIQQSIISDVQDDEISVQKEEKLLPVTSLLLICVPFTCLWMISNFLFNYSLSKTSLSSSQIILTTNTFWTLIFCHILKIELLNLKNLLAVIITIVGAVIVSIADFNKGFGTLVGNIAAAFSALFYGAYTTFLRYKIKNEDKVNMGMFYGFVGFVTMTLTWPILIIFHYTKFEIFSLPTLRIIGFLVLNGLVATALSDLLWSLSLLLTSPIIAAFSLALTVPFAMFADLMLKKKDFHVLYIVGSIVVLVGFVLASIFKYRSK